MSKPPVHLETRKTIGKAMVSPTANRNKEAIGDVLSDLLPTKAHVLEIAAGSGEHALHMIQIRPDLIWTPSDPDENARESQIAWSPKAKGQIQPPLNIDVTEGVWGDLKGSKGLKPAKFDAIFCANMLHIAPWDASIGLALGAKTYLKSSGQVFIYGPFLDGEKSEQSNLDFDGRLKARNPAWGVRELRDVKHIFAVSGFNFVETIAMPARNLILHFAKT